MNSSISTVIGKHNYKTSYIIQYQFMKFEFIDHMCMHEQIIDDYFLEATQKRFTILIKCSYTVFIVNRVHSSIASP